MPDEMNVAIFLCKCDRFEESVRHLLVRCDWEAVVIISQEESYALPCRVTSVTRVDHSLRWEQSAYSESIILMYFTPT